MHVPMVLARSVNPYLAARTLFLLIKHRYWSFGVHRGERISNQIQSVALPGLGTGVGQLGPNVCAHQVRTASDVYRSAAAPAMKNERTTTNEQRRTPFYFLVPYVTETPFPSCSVPTTIMRLRLVASSAAVMRPPTPFCP